MNVMKEINRINSREIQLGTAGSAGSWHEQYKDSPYVFVGGFPFEFTEGDLLIVFSQYGHITDVNLVRDKKTGKSKGFAFIAYENFKSTTLAVDNFNGIKLGGRIIRVDHVADYKPPKDEEEERKRKIDAGEEDPGPVPKKMKFDDHMRKLEKKEKKKLKKMKRREKKEKRRIELQLTAINTGVSFEQLWSEERKKKKDKRRKKREKRRAAGMEVSEEDEDSSDEEQGTRNNNTNDAPTRITAVTAPIKQEVTVKTESIQSRDAPPVPVRDIKQEERSDRGRDSRRHRSKSRSRSRDRYRRRSRSRSRDRRRDRSRSRSRSPRRSRRSRSRSRGRDRSRDRR